MLKFEQAMVFKKIIFLLVVSTLACTQVKVPKHEKGSVILNAYTQKEIPGVVGEITKNYLNCSTQKEAIQWDSLSYANNTYIIDQYSNHIKVELRSNATELKTVSVVVYYKTGDRNFKLILDGISQKEDLYLP